MTDIPFTGDQHYQAADQELRVANQYVPGSERERNALLKALAHATLAAAAVHMDVAHTVEVHGRDGKSVAVADSRTGAGYGR